MFTIRKKEGGRRGVVLLQFFRHVGLWKICSIFQHFAILFSCTKYTCCRWWRRISHDTLSYFLMTESLRTQIWVCRIFLWFEITRARSGTQKLSTWMKGKHWGLLFFEHVNGHFSVEINTCGSTYSNKMKIILEMTMVNIP